LKSVWEKMRKILAFLRLYGLGRTYAKVAGRTRKLRFFWKLKSSRKDISIIGCGQFGFATIGYCIYRRYGSRFTTCFDTDSAASHSFGKLFSTDGVSDSADNCISAHGVDYVFIASNHASHSKYAISAMLAGKHVYIEKPICTSFVQLRALLNSISNVHTRVAFGYNRPFSPAIRRLRILCAEELDDPISLQCFVAGHIIPLDHWYRNEGEGTRICGNAGHWIDLFVHILFWKGGPKNLRIQLTSANLEEKDDNFCLSISTDQGDIFSLFLTSRNEPFEGINETINFQCASLTAKIDDFRRMEVLQDDKRSIRRFWPKNAGHAAAIYELFDDEPLRRTREVVVSTIVILRITEMIEDGLDRCRVDIVSELEGLPPLKT
jgi:predicted dehydrogenase